jgi:hypothetical protein
VDQFSSRNVSLQSIQEAEELLMPVALHVPPEDFTGQDIQRREQRGRSVPLVVVGHGCTAALLHRQPRLGAVERLDLGLLVDREHHGMDGRTDVEVHDVVQFVHEGGVLRQFEDTPAMRRKPVRSPDPLATPSPTAFAIARAVQWVASCGGGACVSRTTSAVLPAEIGALPGGRVLSDSRPSTPASANRACQRQTVVFDFPAAAMMACVPSPSAVSRMIRARQTCFWAAFRSETIASSLRWSEAETVLEIPVRMTQIRTEGARRESQIGLFRLGQSTSWQAANVGEGKAMTLRLSI